MIDIIIGVGIFTIVLFALVVEPIIEQFCDSEDSTKGGEIE